MKRIFLAKRNALLSPANFSWGAFALAGAIFLLLLRLLFPNFFWHAFAPVFRASDALAEKSHLFFNSFGDIAELAAQNEKLADENAALALENQALLQKVNSISGLAAGSRGIIAGVVSRPPLSPYDTLVLAAGSNDGVTLGMEVFGLTAQAGEGGTPLGVVSSVLADFSIATLFSSPGMFMNGWVGQRKLPLVISGAGAGSMNASVARSAGIAAGDIVFVPGPGMLPIGSVVRVDSDPSSPSVTLRIRQALNLFTTTWVALRDIGTALHGAFSSTAPMLP